MIYEKYSDAETPKSYFYWATITAICAAVGRNVALNKKYYPLYPNLYVMLVGESGLRKGAATDLCSKLVTPLEVSKVVEGMSSIEAIVRDLGEQITLESGKVLSDASGLIIANELAAAFVASPQTQLTLTDLYDSNYRKDYKVRLKKGNHFLKNISISMCSATNEANLDVFLDKNSISGGFIARTLIVKEEEKALINPLIEHDKEKLTSVDLADVIERLKEISKVKGQFTLTRAAKDLYIDWYDQLNNKSKATKEMTGTGQRIHDHALKVGMALSLAEGLDLIMTDEHLWSAIESVTGRLKDVIDMTVGAGKSEIAKGTKIVLTELHKASNHSMWRRDMLKRNYRDIEAPELDRVIDHLDQSGIVIVERGSAGIKFSLNPDRIEDVGEFLRRIEN